MTKRNWLIGMLLMLLVGVPFASALTLKGLALINCKPGSSGTDVTFSPAFATTPIVTVVPNGFAGFCQYSASNITTTGFHVNVAYPGGPQLNGIPVAWSAHD